jgi:CheY-like chemotaxis protein
VLTDAHQLEIALLNLAINARDAMPQGGTLTLAGRNLAAGERPEVLTPGDYVAISVRDTGSGMPPEALARAVEPFFTTKREGQGTGLGLPMVHGFATKSGGCLRIDSRPGAGTAVDIILPRAAISGMELGEDPPAGGESAVPTPPKCTILLVGDDELVRQITVGYLRDHGYTVVEAPNAETAIVLSHSIETLDLLLTDVQMPGMAGPGLAMRLRAERPDLPVLFLSGLADYEGLDGADVLAKPFTGAALAEAIQRRLGSANEAADDGRLLRRLRSPALCAAYLAWRAAHDGGRPPRLPDLEWGGLPEADNAFTVAVEPDGDKFGFRFLRVGRALTERLGRPLDGTLAFGEEAGGSGDDVLGSLESAYRRCARAFSPSYEYARYDFGDGEPVVFERLVLPASDDGTRVTHLVGIALFTDAERLN